MPYTRYTLILGECAKYLNCKLGIQYVPGAFGEINCPKRAATHHIKGGKHVTIVVIGLQIFCDISKRGEVFWVLGGTGDVTNFMLSNYVLEEMT